MTKIAQLRRLCQRRTGNLYDTIFTRRVSIYLTAVAGPLGLSPNQVSLLGAAVGAAACALIAFGTARQLLVGAGLIHLYAVLDSVDGELARWKRRFSLKGLFIEDLSAYSMINGFSLATAWYLRRHGSGDLPLVVAVVLLAFGRNAMPVARRAWLKSISTRRPCAPVASTTPGASSDRFSARLRHFVLESMLHPTNMWVVLSSLMVAETLGAPRSLRLVELTFFGYSGLWALKELAIVGHWLRGDALEQELKAIQDSAARPPPAADEVDGRDLASYGGA